MKNFIVSLLLLFTFHENLLAQSGITHTVITKIPLEGDGGWDYLAYDEVSDLLFVSHGTKVQVVDMKTKKMSGTIPDTKGVHGIAIANDLNKGFISNGKDTSVTVFNLKTLATISKIKVTGINPDAILYDQFSHQVFVFNGRTNNATVIDANTEQVVATIALDGKPEFSASDEKGKIYVNIEDKNELSVINTSKLLVEQTWSLAPGEEPTGLAIDNKNHRLFAVCGNKMMVVVNALNGKIITTLPIGDHCDGVVFDAGLNCAYASNGEGTITVVKAETENSYKVIETISTQKGAKTIALDKKTHHLFLTTADFEPLPDATPENPKPRSKIKPGTFVVLEIAPSE